MVEIIDRIMDGFQVLTSDWGRFGGIFLITAIIFGGMLAADSVIPAAGLSATKHINVNSFCSTITIPYIFPLFTHLTDMNTGFLPINCAVIHANLVVIFLYYLQVQALVLAILLIGIIVLNLSG